jgi:hypothetical protein
MDRLVCHGNGGGSEGDWREMLDIYLKTRTIRRGRSLMGVSDVRWLAGIPEEIHESWRSVGMILIERIRDTATMGNA